MRIIFFGSSVFALPALKALFSSGHEIIQVVTQPDKEKGRGLVRASTAVKKIAVLNKVAVYQPEKINNQESIKFLSRLSPDLFVVISYGQILPARILEIPKRLSINLHASLLPKYRGAAPINWALINGEKETGITVIKMNEKMDAGEIVLQKKIYIDSSDTAVSLEEKLSQDGTGLLLESIKLIEMGKVTLFAQDEGMVSFAPKLKKGDGRINWSESAEQIRNLIRGTYNWPGSFTYYKGKLLKIYKAEVAVLDIQGANYTPGEIVKIKEGEIILATGRDYLAINELQLEGKRKMVVKEFIPGHRLEAGEKFHSKN